MEPGEVVVGEIRLASGRTCQVGYRRAEAGLVKVFARQRGRGETTLRWAWGEEQAAAAARRYVDGRSLFPATPRLSPETPEGVGGNGV